MPSIINYPPPIENSARPWNVPVNFGYKKCSCSRLVNLVFILLCVSPNIQYTTKIMRQLVFQAASEMLGCTPWMDTLNRLWALLRNAKLLPFKLMSQSTKCCAGLSESNLTSMYLLDLETCKSSKCPSKLASSMTLRTSALVTSNFWVTIKRVPWVLPRWKEPKFFCIYEIFRLTFYSLCSRR